MIPSAITRTLVLPKLEPDHFVATEWPSASDKAKFANHLLRFIAEGYPRQLFTKVFYRRLSNCFRHIAQYADDAGMRSRIAPRGKTATKTDG